MFEQILHAFLLLVSLAGLGLFLTRLDRACRALTPARVRTDSRERLRR